MVRNKFKLFIFLVIRFRAGIGYSFRYFAGDHSFTKADIISKLNEIPMAKYYLPDDCKWSALSHDLLFAVRIFF